MKWNSIRSRASLFFEPIESARYARHPRSSWQPGMGPSTDSGGRICSATRYCAALRLRLRAAGEGAIFRDRAELPKLARARDPRKLTRSARREPQAPDRIPKLYGDPI